MKQPIAIIHATVVPVCIWVPKGYHTRPCWVNLRMLFNPTNIQVILFKIDCAIFYTNLQELFFQFISWTNWVNSGKFMGNSWISCQVMADMEKNCDNFITINLYVYFREYVCTLYIVNGFYLDGIPFSVVKAPQKVIYLWPLTRPTGLHAINFYSTIPKLYTPSTLNQTFTEN